MAKVFLPYELRRYANGKGEVDVEGATLGVVVKNLEEMYPGISEHLLQDGRLKPGLAAVVGHAATRQGLLQPLGPDTEVHFVPAISGG
jgi:molybdopterin synthase sulfur carrier subunit